MWLLERCCIILGWAWVSSKLHFKCPHVGDHKCWHAAICPAGLLWLHKHRLSFTVKPWASRESYVWAVMPGAKPCHRTFCCLSLAACLKACHVIVRLISSFDKKVSFHVCCQRIQLESSLLSLSFSSILQSGSSPSHSLSWLSWGIRRHGHLMIVKYLNALILN